MGIIKRILAAIGVGRSAKAGKTTKKAASKKVAKKKTVAKKTKAATPKKKAATPTKAKSPAKSPAKPAAKPRRRLAPHGAPPKKPASAAKKSTSTAPSAFESTYLEFVGENAANAGGASSKYWKIIFLDPTTTQVFNGHIGVPRGQAQDPKEHVTPAAARKHYDKMVASKLKKGYRRP